MVINKRGWIKILEATIAVMLVSGILVVVYSKQDKENVGPGEYVYNMQKQILMDISSNRDLRNDVLSGDKNDNIKLNLYVRKRVPNVFSYSLRICNLTDPPTPCKLSPEKVIATRNENVYVDGTIISADFASGYHPMKVRLFVWKKIINNSCGPQCSEGVSSVSCSADKGAIVTTSCGDFNGTGCLENQTITNDCGKNEICSGGTCVSTGPSCKNECSSPGTINTCSADSKEVLTKTCGDFNGDGCLENSGTTVSQNCGAENQTCSNGTCVKICSDKCSPEGDVYKSCSGNRREVLTQTCERNSEGCLEYSTPTTDKTCGVNERCVAGECVNSLASLSLTFSNVVYKWQAPYNNNYYHTNIFKETNGIGVILKNAQLCYLNGACDPKGTVRYTIPGYGQLVLKNQYFRTTYNPDKFILTYWGTDDYGHAISVKQTMSVSGASHTP